MLGFLLMVLLGLYSSAQDVKDQVKVRITKEVDGESRTFEKTYASDAEMRADEEFKTFMGDDARVDFWLSDDARGTRLDERGNHFYFELDEDGDHSRHFRMIHPGDSGVKQFEFHMDMLAEQMKEMETELQDHFKKLDDEHVMVYSFGDEGGTFDWQFPDSLAEDIRLKVEKLMREHGEHSRHMEVVIIKKVSISEEVGEFGKKAQVKASNQLELTDLSYYPNPAPDGRFKLRFNTPSEGELSVKIFNLDGKEVFNRYFERYSGLFSETIDLSRQKEGVYLLEIQQDGKRLTRKVVVD